MISDLIEAKQRIQGHITGPGLMQLMRTGCTDAGYSYVGMSHAISIIDEMITERELLSLNDAGYGTALS